MRGKVKFFNKDKGFGFITSDDKKDYFVHCTNIKSGQSLIDGEVVEFEIGEGKKGPMAVNVYSMHDKQQGVQNANQY